MFTYFQAGRGEPGRQGSPGRQGPEGEPGIYDPNLDETGFKGVIGPQGPIGMNIFPSWFS